MNNKKEYMGKELVTEFSGSCSDCKNFIKCPIPNTAYEKYRPQVILQGWDDGTMIAKCLSFDKAEGK